MRRWLGQRKVSVSLAGVVVVLAFTTGSLIHGPRPWLRVRVGTGLDAFSDTPHNFLSPITSVFFASNTFEYLLAIAAIVVLVGAAERLMGPWRTAVAFVVTAFVGAGVGMLLQAAGLLAREVWAVRINEIIVLDPFTAISGTLMTASGFAGPLWRRRVRVLGFAALIIVFLYSGQPSDLFRIIAALAGLALGMLLSATKPQVRWRRSSHHEARSLLAVALMITAAGPFISIFTPALYGPMHPLGLLFRNQLPHVATVMLHCHKLMTPSCQVQMELARLNGVGAVLLAPLPLVVLIVAALGMLRGRRSAAIVAIAVNVLLALLAGFYYGLLPASGSRLIVPDNATEVESFVRLAISVLVPLVIATIIALNLAHFSVRTPRRLAARFVAIVGGSFVILSAGYVGLALLDRRQFRPTVTLRSLLFDLPDRFVPIGFLRLERITFLPTAPFTRLLYQWVGPLFWIVLIAAAIPLFFSDRALEGFAERDRVRALLREGGDSLGHLALWNGNSYWFSHDGRIVIPYRVIAGVAITTAGPIGATGTADKAIGEFAVFCDDNGWTPVFYSVPDTLAPVFDAMGWSSMVVAEETVLHPETFSTRGKSWQDVRSSFNRAERLGVRAIWTSWSQLSIAHSAQIESISEEWVADKKLPELGFTLGGLDEVDDPDVAVL
ncbi:MAG: phosphatidylglycerol lysyltransferase, partial [Microbacteriaceae bacterium]|nr:phosphatidylglycerol lysyltransferase [Microbacteriaceae bacterium]